MTSKKTETVARNVADKRKPRSQSAASNKKAASAAAPKPVSKKIPRKNLIAGKHPAPQKSSTKAGAESSELTFPVVGVGASAGGLEAFSALLRNLDPVAGMAYVLVQHLDPRRTSALVELLSRETVMPVAEAKDGMAVVPNRVYIIPPSANLAILHGVLHLMPLIQDQGLHLSIDYFFRSLAEDQGSNAIGVILSGTASDGVLGLKAIKAEGGITFSQDEKSAKYEGMPRSAMAAGCVDFVLPPDRIALELRGVARHPYVAHARGGELGESLPLGEEDMSKIFILLRSYSGVDFAYYKQATIRRRIKRRMLLHKMERLSDYVRYLQDSQSEVSALYHDMLINVTSFFRDPEVFDSLNEKVFPVIVNSERSPEMPIRIWVPGCATGEEAYSIGMALMEFLGEKESSVQVQIFATDIDEEALEKARAGIYPEAVAQDVSAERLRRFFTKVEGGYQIIKPMRDMCLFAKQNAIKDPPFSRLDLVSCRNLLIYLGPVLQKKALAMFHYALKPIGFLMLGTAETVGDSVDLFRLVDQRAKIYAKKSIATPLHLDFSMPSLLNVNQATVAAEGWPADVLGPKDMQKDIDRLIMDRYGPSGVVINDQWTILQFRGHTGDYLEPAPGAASLNLMKMAREGLLPDLHSAVTQAIKDNKPVRKEGVCVKAADREVKVNLEVVPLGEVGGSARVYLVVFQSAGETRTRPRARRGKATLEEMPDSEAAKLSRELAANKEYLQSVIEQQESTNEELRSANEEIQSSNEELQSSNEELETAKEELQSVNEELATVNEELESRNAELSLVNNDLNNLINSVNIPIVIVGRDLQIRRFSPLAEKTLNLIGSDIGRPIGNIKPNIGDLNLDKLVRAVIETVHAKDIEVQDTDGRWFTVRIRPYMTSDNKIDGAIIAFIDIDEIKCGYEAAKESRDFAEAVIGAMRYPLLVLDEDLQVRFASTAYLDTFKVSIKETVGNLLYRLGNGQWGIPALRALLEEAIVKNKPFDNFEIEHKFEKTGQRRMMISGRPIPAGINRKPLVLMQLEDVTGKEA